MKIEIKNLTFGYEPNNPVLQSVNTVIDNESVAIVGQNGAGKTTFIRMLNGILPAPVGTVFIDGVDVTSKKLYEWAHKIGYVFQNPNDQLFQETVFKEIEFSLNYLNHSAESRKKTVYAIADELEITDYLKLHPAELPYSQKKVITLASIMSLDPELILLDEPTAGQDCYELENFSRIIQKLKTRGKQFITISHDMEFVAANYKRALAFKAGQIMLDAPIDEFFTQTETLEKCYVVPPVTARCSNLLGYDTATLNEHELVNKILSK